MRDSRRPPPIRSERPEPLDKSGEHAVPHSHHSGFPGQNTMPMQPQMYHYMTPQQQHMSNMAQFPPGFPMGPPMTEGPYNGMPMAGPMNGSMGPSPVMGAVPQRGMTPGVVPPSQYEPVDQNPFVTSHYARPLPNQAYPAFDGGGKTYAANSLTPGSKPPTPADARPPAGSAAYPTQYPSDYYNQSQAYLGSAVASPYASNFGGNDENVEKPKAPPEEEQQSAKKPQVPTQNPIVTALRSQYLRKYQSEQALLRIYALIDTINHSAPRMTDIVYWRRFSDDYFTPRASIRHTKKLGTDYRFFEISMPMLPMMWVSLSTLDVQRIEVSMSQVKAEVLSNGNILFHTPALAFAYHYSDGSYITHHSQLKGSFDPSLKIQWLDLFVYKFTPGIEWSSLERVISKPNLGLRKILKSTNRPGTDQLNHNDGSGNQQRENQDELAELRSNVVAFKSISGQGLHEGILRVFQVSDVMSALTDLCVFQKDKQIQSPLEALNAFVKENGDGSMNNSTADNVNGLHSSESSGMTRAKNISIKEEHMSMSTNSPACSPREVKGAKPVISETGPQLKRRRSNKAAPRSSRGSSSSTPTSESFDCNGIPGTKKIKF